MGKEKSMTGATAGSSWFAEMFHVGLYKRTQGKIARQVTFYAIGVSVALAAWRLYEYMNATSKSGGVDVLLSIWPFKLISLSTQDSILDVVEFMSLPYLVPLALLSVGLWVGYRLVNYPRFADFLIAVEAEMNKVSWPSKDELIRSSIVVIFVIVTMSALLYGYDALWTLIFSDKVLGILHSTN